MVIRIIVLLLLINLNPIQVDAEYSRYDKERKCLGFTTVGENVEVTEEECEQILKMYENLKENSENDYHEADLNKDGIVTKLERKEYIETITPADKEKVTLSLSPSLIFVIIFICVTAIVITLINKNKRG